MIIPTKSYENIFRNYTDALKWMKSIGVQIGPGRTSHYEKILTHWKDNYEVGSKIGSENIFPDFVSSIVEVYDFIDIYKAFRDVSVVKLFKIADKLQKGVNGPINAVDEKSNSTTARNFLFEATVAARSHRPLLGVETILNAESDTGIKIKNNKIWIECKRVTSYGKIEANVKKATKQLESIIKKRRGSGHRGIVALDITKLLTPGDQIFVTANDSQLVSSVDRMMDDFVEKYYEIWQELYKRRHKKIIGTFLRFSFMATSESRNILVHTSQWGINPRKGISESDDRIQKTLASILNQTRVT